MSYPIYPPLYVGIGGEIKLSASLALGFDTYGISKFFDSHNIVDIFDGFYVDDNIVNGVDLPEVRLDAKLAAFASSTHLHRARRRGRHPHDSSLDIYGENRDNKYRASELIAAVSEDPSTWSRWRPAGSAYIAAYVDIFLLFDWERVWEWTFMDVTLFYLGARPGGQEAHPRHHGRLHAEPQRRLRRGQHRRPGVGDQHLRRPQAPQHR